MSNVDMFCFLVLFGNGRNSPGARSIRVDRDHVVWIQIHTIRG